MMTDTNQNCQAITNPIQEWISCLPPICIAKLSKYSLDTTPKIDKEKHVGSSVLFNWDI